jgi:hypothetical protein
MPPNQSGIFDSRFSPSIYRDVTFNPASQTDFAAGFPGELIVEI